ENKGEGAFYGPKIDFNVKDSLGRSWQLGTVQLDFAMAERLEAVYIDQKGKKQHPVIIHRAILGSIERFIAVLLEHTAGALPVWLSPIQAQILPVSDKFLDYAREVEKKLKEAGLRVEINDRNETLGKKIRSGKKEKIPYLLVVGPKEEKAQTVSVESREKGDLGQMELDKFLGRVRPG
ncbi:unnamed protein product, partial [marine sediment metagenome]